MVKKEIRKIYSSQRMSLHDDEIGSMTAAMVETFRQLSLNKVQLLLSYFPIVAKKEFDVSLCEREHLVRNVIARVAWPRLASDGVTMNAVVITPQTVLSKNKYGIYEPQSGEIADPHHIDAVFVPLLAFDLRGYRVGYGKGFYDRYLAKCAPGIIKIGFSFFEAIPSIDDVDHFDVPLNYCITPLRVYEF